MALAVNERNRHGALGEASATNARPRGVGTGMTGDGEEPMPRLTGRPETVQRSYCTLVGLLSQVLVIVCVSQVPTEGQYIGVGDCNESFERCAVTALSIEQEHRQLIHFTHSLPSGTGEAAEATSVSMDTSGMNTHCTWAREAASAAADDELGGGDTERLADHLAGCRACAEFADRVAVLTRTTRIRVAHSDPMFVARVMSDARPARLGRGGWLRPSLAWCGLVVAFHNIEPLVFGKVDGVQSHLARHAGASGAALALALLFVAWRPSRAYGLLPFVSALVALTVTGTLLDSAAGVTHTWNEAAHLAEVTGLVMLWMMAGSPGLDRAATGGPLELSEGEPPGEPDHEYMSRP